MRARAFKNGDEAAVRGMYDLLKQMAESADGVGLKGLQRQLLKEFGVDVAKPVEEKTKLVDEAELAEALES